MQADSKKINVVRGLLVALIVACLGVLGWLIWHKKANSPITAHSNACSVSLPAAEGQSFKLPSGWQWYELKAAGLKYAYPNTWTHPTTQTNTGSEKYLASFTVAPSGANTTVALSQSCSDFRSIISDINNGKFDVLDSPATTIAISHDQNSYSSMSHWMSDAGNQYKLVESGLVSVGEINSVTVGYSVTTGAEICPDNALAQSSQSKCIGQSIGDQAGTIIRSLQKI